MDKIRFTGSGTEAVMFAPRLMLGAMTVVAPPLFDAASAPALAGFALGAYAFGTAVGGLLYGVRRAWPGTHERQCSLCCCPHVAGRDSVNM